MAIASYDIRLLQLLCLQSSYRPRPSRAYTIFKQDLRTPEGHAVEGSGQSESWGIGQGRKAKVATLQRWSQYLCSLQVRLLFMLHLRQALLWRHEGLYQCLTIGAGFQATGSSVWHVCSGEARGGFNQVQAAWYRVYRVQMQVLLLNSAVVLLGKHSFLRRVPQKIMCGRLRVTKEKGRVAQVPWNRQMPARHRTPG